MEKPTIEVSDREKMDGIVREWLSEVLGLVNKLVEIVGGSELDYRQIRYKISNIFDGCEYGSEGSEIVNNAWNSICGMETSPDGSMCMLVVEPWRPMIQATYELDDEQHGISVKLECKDCGYDYPLTDDEQKGLMLFLDIFSDHLYCLVCLANSIQLAVNKRGDVALYDGPCGFFFVEYGADQNKGIWMSEWMDEFRDGEECFNYDASDQEIIDWLEENGHDKIIMEYFSEYVEEA